MTNMPTRFISITFNSPIPLHRQSFPEGLAVLHFYKPSEAGHQGTFEDGRQKLQKLIFMITIESLVEQGANVKLEVTPSDLKMFAESIIQRTIMAQQEEQKAAIQREAKEIYLNTKQVRELLNVCDGTLNLWAKRGYLVPIKVGNKNMYAKSDIRRVQTGGKSESVTSYCKRKEK